MPESPAAPADSPAAPAPAETLSEETIKKVVAHLLEENVNGFSVNPRGVLIPEKEAVEITSIDQFSRLARDPREITIDLYAGKSVKFKVKPLDVNEQKEIDALDNDAPLPPKKKKPAGLSLAKGAQDPAADEYDFQDKDYRKKLDEYRELKCAATIVKGLVSVEIPGETLEIKRAFLAERFPPRILDAIFNSIRSLTTDPIESALFR